MTAHNTTEYSDSCGILIYEETPISLEARRISCLSLRDIAGYIRRDIRRAIKDGSLSRLGRVSVRSHRFAGGRAISLRYGSEYLPHHKTLDRMLNAYHSSETRMTGGDNEHSVNFYTRLTFDDALSL